MKGVDGADYLTQYLLRAVLFNTGALVAGKQLYVYIRSDDGTWWRIKEHEVTMVSQLISADCGLQR